MKRRRAARCGMGFLLIASLAFAPIGAAAASAEQPSSWWYDVWGVAEAHAAGWNGEGVKVAVIDQQINTALPVFDGTNLAVDPKPLCKGGHVVAKSDAAIHGSDMVALLVGNGEGRGGIRGIAPRATVLFYGIGATVDEDCEDDDGVAGSVGEGIDRALAGGARIISISLGVPLASADRRAVARALIRGTVVVAAVPNSLGVVDRGWPWGYNGVVAVNAIDQKNRIQPDQKFAGALNVWTEATVVAPGVAFPSVDWTQYSSVTGASLATPLTAGVLALAAQKYPKATGNHLIQSLIHNTWRDDHPLERDTRDGYGYGAVSVRHMLREDPSQYSDVNPLMDKASGVPDAQDLAEAASPSPTVVPAPRDPTLDSATTAPLVPAATPGPSADELSTGSPLLGFGVGAGVIVIAIGAIVLVRRMKRGQREGER